LGRSGLNEFEGLHTLVIEDNLLSFSDIFPGIPLKIRETFSNGMEIF